MTDSDTAPLGAPVPSGPTGAAVIVTAGAGGVDAHFAAFAFTRMIEGYALKLGYSVYDAIEDKTPDGGVKTATFAVAGDAAFERLVMLSGVHRLTRFSPSDPEGRRTASYALVTVAPLVAWGSLRYSYGLDPYTKATNHQTGASTPEVESVLGGNLDLLFGAVEPEPEPVEVSTGVPPNLDALIKAYGKAAHDVAYAIGDRGQGFDEFTPLVEARDAARKALDDALKTFVPATLSDQDRGHLAEIRGTLERTLDAAEHNGNRGSMAFDDYPAWIEFLARLAGSGR
jgi:hypothetical protein